MSTEGLRESQQLQSDGDGSEITTDAVAQVQASSADEMEVQTDGEASGIMADASVFQEAYLQLPVQDPQTHGQIILKTRKKDSRYSMEHKKRGLMLIFNFEKFDKSNIEDRDGSLADVIQLRTAFQHLQFVVEEYNNMSYDEFKAKLNKVATDDHNDHDCLAVAIMTHGEKDELWASNKKFSIKELWKPFTAENCKTLVGKPKMFFIQACRGLKFEKSVKVLDAGSAPARSTYHIPNACDILLAHATFEGRVAARNKTRGTWFMQSLAAELLQNGRTSSLLSLLTSVIRSVAIDCEQPYNSTEVLKQQPVIISTLCRKVYFKIKH